MRKSKVDLTAVNHGTVVILQPLTAKGRRWLNQNVNAESWQLWGDGVAAEPRYIGNVLDGAAADGLRIG